MPRPDPHEPPAGVPDPRPTQSELSSGQPQDQVRVPASGLGWRQWLAVAGPGLLISVGYMDPGNWATDLAGGSRYGYRLLWVLLMSNLMAILLQCLAARLGLVRRRDLAQASRETYPPVVNLALCLMAEVAGAELVILGGHGHRGLSVMIYGTTVEALRHHTRASVLVIPLRARA